MGMLPLKKRVNRDKCSFATKQRMFGVFAIDEILRYRGTRFPGSRTLCHPAQYNLLKILTLMSTACRGCPSHQQLEKLLKLEKKLSKLLTVMKFVKVVNI